MTNPKIYPGIAIWNTSCANDSALSNVAISNKIDTWLDPTKKDETIKAANWLRMLADLMEKDVAGTD